MGNTMTLDMITLDQLYEIRSALWEWYDRRFDEYSSKLQTLEIGSNETKTLTKAWESQRDNIKSAQKLIQDRITELQQEKGPAIRRRNRNN